MPDESFELGIVYQNDLASLNRATREAQQKIRESLSFSTGNGLSNSSREIENSLGRQTKAVTDFGDQYKKNINRVNDEQQKLNKNVRDGTLAFDNFSQRVGFSANRLAAYILPAKAFLQVFRGVEFARSGILDLNKSLVQLEQIFDGNISRARQVSDAVLDIATAYGQSGREIQNVALLLAQSGFAENQRELIQVTRAFAQASLAPTFGDISNTVQGGIAFLNQFKLSTEDLVPILDSANELAKQFAVSSEDLFTAVERGGASFAAFGGDFQDFQSVVAGLRQLTRLPASTIGSGLNTLSIRLFRQSNLDLIENLGVNTSNNGQLRDFIDILSDVSVEFEKLQDAERPAIVEALFGTRQGKLGVALLSDLSRGADSVVQRAQEISRASGGSLYRDQIRGLDRIDVQLTRIGSSIDETLGKLAQDESFQDFIRGISNTIVGLSDALQDNIPTLTAFIKLATLLGTTLAVRSIKNISQGFGFNSPGRFGTSRNRNSSPGSLGLSGLGSSGVGASTQSLIQRQSSSESLISAIRKDQEVAFQDAKRRQATIESIQNNISLQTSSLIRNATQINRNLFDIENPRDSSRRQEFLSNFSRSRANPQDAARFRDLDRLTQIQEFVRSRESVVESLNVARQQRNRLDRAIVSYGRGVELLTQSVSGDFGRQLAKRLESERSQLRNIASGEQIGRILKNTLPSGLFDFLSPEDQNNLNSGNVPSPDKLRQAAVRQQDKLARALLIRDRVTDRILQRESRLERLDSSELLIGEEQRSVRGSQLSQLRSESINAAIEQRKDELVRSGLSRTQVDSLALQADTQKKIQQGLNEINSLNEERVSIAGEINRLQRFEARAQRRDRLNRINNSRGARFARFLGIESLFNGIRGDEFRGADRLRRRRQRQIGADARSIRGAAGIGGLIAGTVIASDQSFQDLVFGQRQTGLEENDLRRDRARAAQIGALQSSLSFATTGALIGGRFGPQLALAGAVGGAAFGAFSGFSNESRSQRDRLSIAISESENLNESLKLFRQRFGGAFTSESDRIFARGSLNDGSFGGNLAEELSKNAFTRAILTPFDLAAQFITGKDTLLSDKSDIVKERKQAFNSQDFVSIKNLIFNEFKDDFLGSISSESSSSEISSTLSSLFEDLDLSQKDLNLFLEQGGLSTVTKHFVELGKKVQKELLAVENDALGLQFVNSVSSLSRSNRLFSQNLSLNSIAVSQAQGNSLNSLGASGSILTENIISSIINNNLSNGLLQGIFSSSELLNINPLIGANTGQVNALLTQTRSGINRGQDESTTAGQITNLIGTLGVQLNDGQEAAIRSAILGGASNLEELQRNLVVNSGAFNSINGLGENFIRERIQRETLRQNIQSSLTEANSSRFSVERARERASIDLGRRNAIFNNSDLLIQQALSTRVASVDPNSVENIRQNILSLQSIRDTAVQTGNRDLVFQTEEKLLQETLLLADATARLNDSQARLSQQSSDLSQAFSLAATELRNTISEISGRSSLGDSDILSARIQASRLASTGQEQLFRSLGADPSSILGLDRSTILNLNRTAGLLDPSQLRSIGLNDAASGIELARGLGVGRGTVNQNISENLLRIGSDQNNVSTLSRSITDVQNEQIKIQEVQVRAQEKLAERLQNTERSFINFTETYDRVSSGVSGELNALSEVMDGIADKFDGTADKIVAAFEQGLKFTSDVTVSGLQGVNASDNLARYGMLTAAEQIINGLSDADPSVRAIKDAFSNAKSALEQSFTNREPF